MTLSQEDGQLYYKLWLPLLDYVNKKYRVNRKLKSIATAKELDPAEVKKVANKLWSDVAIIDDYLKENNDLPEDHRKIIQSWKRRVQGRFMYNIELGRDVFWSPHAADNRSNVYAVPGCYHIRRSGNALQHPYRWWYETDV